MPRKFQLEQLGSDPASQAAYGTHQRALGRVAQEIDGLESSLGEQIDAFSPETPSDWDATPPTSVREALNRIAASIFANHGTGP